MDHKGLVLACFCFLVAVAQTSTAQEVVIPSRTEAGGQLQLPAILYRPSGSGPFPAVVMLYGCEGVANVLPLDQKHHAQWIQRLVGWGYVALVLDSFSPRGPSSICDNTASVSPESRSADAYAAKSYLSALPFVDPNNIGVIGWSHGGWAVISIIDRAGRNREDGPFKAAVAFYPLCHPLADPDTPVLVLIGKKDDWCPASLAESLAQDFKRSKWKREFSLTVYPNAAHAFDIELPKAIRYGITFMGHHLDYDAQATSDAVTRTRDFLAKYLQAR
jgi:dienelactone hydrolase